MRKKNRPVNLDLTTIKFPIPAIISIFHRVTGVLLLFFLPVTLWITSLSLQSPDSFEQLQLDLQQQRCCRFAVWIFFSAFVYHVIAGLRHLFMDMKIGESLPGGRLGAKIVAFVSGLLIVLAGVWLW